jgi:hypothetical protein
MRATKCTQYLSTLMVTAKDLDEEELATREGEESDDDSDHEDDNKDDNTDGFMNKLEEMSEVEQNKLDDSVQPI